MTTKSQTWLDHYVERFTGRYIAAAVVLAVVFFVIGGAISWVIGFLKTYLNTFNIYLAVFGIAWTAAWLHWAGQKLQVIIPDLRAALIISDAEFQSYSSLWTQKFFNTRLHIIGSICLIVSSWIFVAVLAVFRDFLWFPTSWSRAVSLNLESIWGFP